MNKLIAVITGCEGQDGSYLAEYLLEKDYLVVGVSRPKSNAIEIANLSKVRNHQNFKFTEGDITDSTFVSRILHQWHPHEYYNLAAQSNVGTSFKEPLSTFQVDAQAVLMQLEMIRQISPYTRFFQASTSEMFGSELCSVDGFDENSKFSPRSPYAVAKVAAHFAVKQYRESYSLFCCSAISFNHSSVRRPTRFATRKITNGVARVKFGLQKTIKMGDLSAFRDESHAKDLVSGFHLMLQQDAPSDFVFGTGKVASIYEMLEFVAEKAGYSVNEIYEKDPELLRPSDVPYLLSNSSKARKELGWEPKYTWKEILSEMYEYDCENLKK